MIVEMTHILFDKEGETTGFFPSAENANIFANALELKEFVIEKCSYMHDLNECREFGGFFASSVENVFGVW